MDFINIGYLQKGSERQKAAYATLSEFEIFSSLKSFSPILTGTIPLAIDTGESDLDIICCWNDKEEFIQRLRTLFTNEKNFHISEKEINGYTTIICHFYHGNFEIEIFAQARASTEQEAYLHMAVEHEILRKMGDGFRQKVIELKKKVGKLSPHLPNCFD